MLVGQMSLVYDLSRGPVYGYPVLIAHRSGHLRLNLHKVYHFAHDYQSSGWP
jgi:hypothetical protein